MSDLSERVANLSPEKRALLSLRLKQQAGKASKPAAIPRRVATTPAPLSFAQQRLWFIDQLDPNSPLYNIPAALRLTGSLNVSVLERTLNEVVRRHQVLRTRFAAVTDQPVQIIAPELILRLPVVDLHALPAAERATEAHRLAAEEARQPFDLTRGPLLRARLLCLTSDEHVLLLTMHHIISDGWSLGVFVQEVVALYTTFSDNKPSPLPDLPIQYADFACWQREWLSPDGGRQSENVVGKQLTYWKQQLGGELPVLELPTDHPRPAEQSHRGAQIEFDLPSRLLRALQTLSRQEGVSLYMTLLAAFQILLHRYTRQEDICVGTPIANRNRSEIERLIGFFVNTLVIRTDLSGAPSFRELLRRVREATLGAYAHQDLPFEMLVDALQPDRTLSFTPLFQVMFALQNAPMQAFDLPGLVASRMENHNGTSKFDLSLLMEENADKLTGWLEYNTDLFDEPTIQRMIGHFGTLLAGIIANPDQSITRLPILPDAERHQLIVEWNDTRADYPRERCVHELFEAQARQTPEAIAATCETAQLTYAALDHCANQLARRLQHLGVQPDVLVGLCVERSLDLVVCALAILKAGGAYVPMDPTYPAERLAFMLDDSHVPVLLTQARVRDRLLPMPDSVKAICLDADSDTIAQESDDAVTSGATAQNLAYVIYTSGSTGRPKGVQLEHGSLLNLVWWHQHAFKVSSTDRATQIAGPGFDASVWELWPYLTAGASIHIPDDETRASPTQLKDWLVANAITITFLPTPVVETILALDWQSDAALRIVLTGGDKLHRHPSAGLPFVLVNNYGPTEDTVVTTSGIVPVVAHADAAPSIGKPIANTQVYVLDAHLQPVPIGIAGELHVGGAGLAREYLNRPELTAEKFIPNPFGSGRLYKTGDLARYLPNGEIEFLGRIDHQVKIRGFRIELGEIEQVLRRRPSVAQALVIAHEDAPGDKRLVAYLVPTAEHLGQSNEAKKTLVGDLRAFLKTRLPDYMVPAAFVLLDAFPITPNGKVDRRALLTPRQADLESPDEFVPPRTPTEEILVGIWAQVLGIERIGVYANFFELGGHSLSATQLVSRVREAFQIELPLRSLFESPTVAGLAQVIEHSQRISFPPIPPTPRDRDLPLSFAQQRLWFLDQLEPSSPLYNVSGAVRLTGTLDVAAFERCLNEIVRRHETLRTAIATTDGKSRQLISPAFTLTLPVTDLSDLPASEREAKALRLATEDARHPFDLARAPLLRVKLLRLTETEHIAVFTMHHIISDGWSVGVLLGEIATLYTAFSGGEPASLPELTIQYGDYAGWEREWLREDVLEKQLAYWKQQLDGVPVLDLPTDRPRPAIQSNRGARFIFTLPADLVQSLYASSRREGVTLFMTLLAAFQTLLHRYSGQDDIAIGTPVANRNRAEIEGLIGFFVNTLVIRGDLSNQPSFRELVRRVRETALGAYAHQDAPFEMLVDALQAERDLSRTPLFQVMFALQNASAQAWELPGLDLSPLPLDTGTATFDLTLIVEERKDGLVCSFEYCTDLFESATIERMAGHFQTLLTGMIAHPDQSISTLPMLTDAERHQLLVEWNDTRSDYPQEQCLHQLFEAQVDRTPGAVAAVFHGQQLSYRDLNARANQLACYLQKHGVEPETLVGVCTERSLEMLVGLLGVLKAGGAYVPLDPSYPPERIAFMLEDSGARILLTQSRLGVDGLLSRGDPNVRLVHLDADWQMIAQESDVNAASGVTPENLAYVIYTSGSTGKPKGVQVPHRAVVNHNWAVMRQFRLEPRDRVLQFSTINFDAAVEEIFPTLLSGATLVLRPAGLLTGNELMQLVEAERLTVLDLPTAYWHEWVYELSLSPAALPASLRLVAVGGEKARADRWALWQKLGDANLAWINTYGPTEATIIATAFHVESGESIKGEIPIGKPIANTQIYLLDQNMQPVPIGIPGELHIGGAGLARGYLNRPELTTEKFISVDSGQWTVNSIPTTDRRPLTTRLYKTGDLARYRPDGNLEFVGRADHQVKLRGFRIELGEIETVLGQHPAVHEAVVLCSEDDANTKRLVAYVAPKEDAEASPSLIDDLREYVKSKLPDYMTPSAFVTLDQLPRMPNGKIDRRALPAPDAAPFESLDSFAAPRNRAEEILAEIWAQVLNMEKVGIHDNFFHLGGDSILSIQVVARANQAGLRLTPRHLFQFPTVAGLAAVANPTETIQKHCEQGVVQGDAPLTPIQHWFFEQKFPEPHHWNQAVLLQVREPPQRAALEVAIAELLSHHDALRLRFTRDASGWRATHANADDQTPLEWFDLSALDEAAQSRTIESRSAELQASLNLTTGPLLRAAYFDLGAERAGRLLLIAHHLIVDTVSWRILLDDLVAAYAQLSRGERVQLPSKTTAFQYWAQRLQEYAQSDALQSELDYWLAASEDGCHRLPTDYERDALANTEASAQSVIVSLDAAETRALLQDVPAAYGTEINDVLLTALAQTFAQWTGSPALTVDLEGHGREDLFEEVDLSRTVGWFTSVFPVRLDLSNVDDPGDALKAVKEQLRRVPKRGIGYGLLRYLRRDALDTARLGAHAEVSFNYLGQFDQTVPASAPFALASEPIGAVRSPRAPRQYLIDVSGSVTGGMLQMEWVYSENLHRRATVEALAHRFIQSLRSLIAHCRSSNTVGYTPSDFPDVELSQIDIDALVAEVGAASGEDQ